MARLLRLEYAALCTTLRLEETGGRIGWKYGTPTLFYKHNGCPIRCDSVWMIGGLLLAVAFFQYQLGGILLEFQAVFGALVFFLVCHHGHLC